MRWLSLMMICVCYSVNAQINMEQVILSGKNAIKQEDYMLAIQYFNLAIQSNSDEPQPYFYRSVAKFNLGDYVGAESDASIAIKYNPFLRDVFELRGATRKNLHKKEGAIADYEKALEALPDNKYILLNLALAYYDVGEVELSKKKISELLIKYPTFNLGYRGFAYIELKQGNFDSALESINSAICFAPNTYEDFMLRAHIYHKQGNGSGALEDYLMALTLKPYDEVALFNKAMLLFEDGDCDNALNDINKLISISPNFSLAYLLKSAIYYKVNNISEAKFEYEKAKSLSQQINSYALGEVPNIVLAKEIYGISSKYNCVLLREPVKNENFEISPEPIFAISYYTTKVDAQFSAIKIQEMEEINSSQLLRYDLSFTNREPSLADSINVYDHLAAIDYYNYNISAHSPRAIDYFGRAIDYYILHEYNAAIDDLNKTLELAPDFALGYFMRAVANFKKLASNTFVENDDKKMSQIDTFGQCDFTDSYRGVVSDWDRVIALSPRMSLAYYNKGCTLMEMFQYGDAVNQFDKAISIDPFMGEAFYNRAYAYIKMGNIERAIEDLSKAGELGVVLAYDCLRCVLNQE